LLPNAAAATSVVIHGAFFPLTNGLNVTYGDPRCGVMYFSCVAGQEAMCRMQWGELASHAGEALGFCYGFGSLGVVSTARIRAEGEALANPDPWDLGLGLQPGVYVDGKCAPALKLACDLDGGAPDASAANDASSAEEARASNSGGAGTSGAAGGGGDAGRTGTTGASGSNAGSGAGGTSGAAGQAAPALAGKSRGCAVAGGPNISALLLVGAALVLAAGRRSRGR
jgi:hypothetical protein